MSGRDVLACAQTGSGKTAAFLLPILHRLIEKPRRTTRALVLTPTRDLAAQILEDFNALAVHTPLTGAAVYGGVGMGPQEHAFRSGVDVIIATPGRLLDHFKAQYARLAGVEYLVLDEADRMLDMGFLPDIRRILKHIPARRQTLFFSATMPPPIGALAADMLKQPKILPAGTRVGVEAVFDNSAANVSNPDPAAWVRFGEKTTDEMMVGFVHYTFVDKTKQVDMPTFVVPEALKQQMEKMRQMRQQQRDAFSAPAPAPAPGTSGR